MTEMNVRVRDAEEAAEEIANLKRYGYKRVANCFWYETWIKDNNRVVLERDY